MTGGTGGLFAHAAPVEGAAVQDNMLKGVSEIHVHAAPDVKTRAIDELSLAHEAKKTGYRSVMFKSNEWGCHDSVYLIRQALPDFACFGSLCMNRIHDDSVNVYAAEMAVRTTKNFCKCIWMPTQAVAYQHVHGKLPGKSITVLSDIGKVLPEVTRVMELCAAADIFFATGHCSPKESLIPVQQAKEVRGGKFVVTHDNSHIWKMTHMRRLCAWWNPAVL